MFWDYRGLAREIENYFLYFRFLGRVSVVLRCRSWNVDGSSETTFNGIIIILLSLLGLKRNVSKEIRRSSDAWISSSRDRPMNLYQAGALPLPGDRGGA